MVKRVYFLAHGGEVQGVGFRFFTRKRALHYNITGWVRNTPNNKVEGEAQGEETSLAEFLKDVNSGPRGAHVVRLDREEREVVEGEGEGEFEIRKWGA
ncbi:Acylphosphatase-like domain-containing protein [Schizothecium vesticola]|uniref:acylphosphatase n=1 Tax=Schizothecium vesticola TaxID=314040 RepID=A0AA40KCV4_9PEZI|nr:Acylphosphatase-like domain-containing protein [Schizothecium vesticola]